MALKLLWFTLAKTFKFLSLQNGGHRNIVCPSVQSCLVSYMYNSCQIFYKTYIIYLYMYQQCLEWVWKSVPIYYFLKRVFPLRNINNMENWIVSALMCTILTRSLWNLTCRFYFDFDFIFMVHWSNVNFFVVWYVSLAHCINNRILYLVYRCACLSGLVYLTSFSWIIVIH